MVLANRTGRRLLLLYDIRSLRRDGAQQEILRLHHWHVGGVAHGAQLVPRDDRLEGGPGYSHQQPVEGNGVRLVGAVALPVHDRNGDSWTSCHYWSNFEIADLDFFRSRAYQEYYKYLDRRGGFYYERV